MDIVYLVKNCVTNDELTYSLRSLVNLPHDKVFLVGGCPTNLNKQTIIHIPTVQGPDKFANTRNNIQLVCKDSRLSDDFILMNDDFFILKPIKDIEELNLCRGRIDQVIDEYIKRYNNITNDYLTGMKQTNIFLKDLGYERPLSYELHTPMVMNKQKVLEIFNLPFIDSIRTIHWRSVYGNLYLKNSQIINDVKVINNYDYELGTDKFLSTEDNSFNRVKPQLKYLFPNRSPYEL